MGKRINYSHRTDSIVPMGDVGALMKPGQLKEYVKSAKPKDRQRLVAFLHSIYSAPELVQMLDIKKTYVETCSRNYRDIIEASQLSRNFAIADLTERRVVELLQKMNIDNIPDEKKAKSVRDLMESADLARGQTKPPTEDKDENVMELVFKVRQKMSKPRGEINITDDVIDITEAKEDEKTLPPANGG